MGAVAIGQDDETAGLRREVAELRAEVATLRRDLTTMAALILELQAALAPKPAAADPRPTRCTGCGGALKYHQAEAGHLQVCNTCGKTRFIHS